jgi:hypothetical protein
MVTFDFPGAALQIDGLELRYRLDDGPTIGLKPVTRPTGTVPSTLELEIADYAKHKQLLLEFAPRRSGEIVGEWRDKQIVLGGGCTAVRVSVDVHSDGGHFDASSAAFDAIAPMDLPKEVRADLALTVDSPLSLPDTPDVADQSQSDSPLVADSAEMPPDVFSPDRAADLPAAADARDSAPDLASTGVVLLNGALGTVGPRRATPNVRLLREGFESSGPQCVNSLCVTGGIVP